MYSLTVLSIRLKTPPIQINVRVVTGRGVTQSTYRPIHWPLPPGPDQVVPKQQYLNTINNPLRKLRTFSQKIHAILETWIHVQADILV